MVSTPRNSIAWTSVQFDNRFGSSHKPKLRTLCVIAVFTVLGYILLLPIYLGYRGLISPRRQMMVLNTGDDAFKHFAGARDCGISQVDLYLAPKSQVPKSSPLCKNRVTLLEGLSNGGRHGYDEPYVGKGCTYRWFSTTEICMILERFNTLIFLGDEIVQPIYTAFNVLLREDLSLGGLQQWLMNDQERSTCTCDNQFTNPLCTQYAIRSIEDIKNNTEDPRKSSPYLCSRITHTYIPSTTIPAIPESQTLFKSLTYARPNPWQPSPLIVSLSHLINPGPPLNTSLTAQSLEEWLSLVTGAERNIPILFLNPPHKDTTNQELWTFSEEMRKIAKEKHVEVLGLWNLTVQAENEMGMKVAIVEAMMVINWLARLDTS